MKKRILYSILNEWRDEDMDNFPIDLDDVDFEPTSSNMSDEPDLGDDDFELSTLHSQYEYFPKTYTELKEIVKMEIKKQGGEHVNLNMIDTSKIDNMRNVFWGCRSLQTLDVSRWNVSSVENMSNMFNGCKSLREVDVSGWDVSHVRYMSYMFSGCESLRELDVSNWKVSEVRDMSFMFGGCTSLETLDISKWNVSSVRDMNCMFYYCQSLKTLDVSGWKVSSVENMKYMFCYCESLHTNTRMWEFNTFCNTEDMYLAAPNINHN